MKSPSSWGIDATPNLWSRLVGLAPDIYTLARRQLAGYVIQGTRSVTYRTDGPRPSVIFPACRIAQQGGLGRTDLPETLGNGARMWGSSV